MDMIGATEFKQRCLEILDRVGPEGIVITKHGKPVAKLIPIASESSDLIGRFRDRIRIKGDLLSTGIRWNAQP